MPISVSEFTILKIAVRLPPAMLDAELAKAAVRKHAFTRRGIAAWSCVLVAGLVALHWKTADPGVNRRSDLVAQLATVKLIDARWDGAAAQARNGMTPPGRTAVQEGDAARIQRTLDAALGEAKTSALRTSIGELKKAYVEKADVASRFEKAAADSSVALAAALRADAAIGTLVRESWRDFPQRDRLVAAENLMLRVLADASQYHHAPNGANRATLEASVSELARPQTLPQPLLPAISRLESDVHQILLIKPLESMLGDRLVTLDTATRVDELADLYQRELTEALVRRDRWRIALIVYTLALLALAGYLGVRAITRYRDLEVLYAGQTRSLAKALMRLRGYEQPRRPELVRREPAQDEEARIVSERRSGGNA